MLFINTQRMVMDAMVSLDLEELRIQASVLDDFGLGLDLVPFLLLAATHPPLRIALGDLVRRDLAAMKAQCDAVFQQPWSLAIKEQFEAQVRVGPFILLLRRYLVSPGIIARDGDFSHQLVHSRTGRHCGRLDAVPASSVFHRLQADGMYLSETTLCPSGLALIMRPFSSRQSLAIPSRKNSSSGWT